MGAITLFIVTAVVISGYFIYHHIIKKKVFSSDEIYNLYEKYKKEGIDGELYFPIKDKGRAESVIGNVIFKKDKIYKPIFYKELPTKDSFRLELYDKSTELLHKKDYDLYFYNTKYCFIVVKKNFKGIIYLYTETPPK